MYSITDEEIKQIFDLISNICIEDKNGYKIDSLSYQQVFKKLYSNLHNKKLVHYTLTGMIYDFINDNDISDIKEEQ